MTQTMPMHSFWRFSWQCTAAHLSKFLAGAKTLVSFGDSMVSTQTNLNPLPALHSVTWTRHLAKPVSYPGVQDLTLAISLKGYEVCKCL